MSRVVRVSAKMVPALASSRVRTTL
jgi:hypothetical protein